MCKLRLIKNPGQLMLPLQQWDLCNSRLFLFFSRLLYSYIKGEGTRSIHCHFRVQKGIKNYKIPLCYTYYIKWSVNDELRSLTPWGTKLLPLGGMATEASVP